MTQSISEFIEIHLEICGDHWINRDQIQDQLIKINNNIVPVRIKIDSEGPSLGALGVFDMFSQWCKSTDRSPESISIQGWFNSVEPSPFPTVDKFLWSHFLWMSRDYSDYSPGPLTQEHRFGLFIGRRTLPRSVILYELWHMDFSTRRKDFFFSLMQGSVPIPRRGINLDNEDYWLGHLNREQYRAWWNSPPVDSIDRVEISDQYSPGKNTNKSLLSFYNRFGAEIVCESYCWGESFFMTEKTVRPIVGLKPMLIYGPKHYLARFKALGFQTWGHIWDESYDAFEGYDRWLAMHSLIKSLSSMSDYAFWDLIHQCEQVAQHNFHHLQDLIKQHSPR